MTRTHMKRRLNNIQTGYKTRKEALEALDKYVEEHYE